MIGGGGYREALPLADRIYLTELPAEYSGDVFFRRCRPMNGVSDDVRFTQRKAAWSFCDL